MDPVCKLFFDINLTLKHSLSVSSKYVLFSKRIFLAALVPPFVCFFFYFIIFLCKIFVCSPHNNVFDFIWPSYYTVVKRFSSSTRITWYFFDDCQFKHLQCSVCMLTNDLFNFVFLLSVLGAADIMLKIKISIGEKNKRKTKTQQQQQQ